MKKNYFLLLAVTAFLALGMTTAKAQNGGIYSKGTWTYDVNQSLGVSFMSDKTNDNAKRNYNTSEVELWALYFPVNHFAGGLYVTYDREKQKKGYSYLNSSTMAYL
ncbi:MAG: hypothetical protein NT175_06070 [Bacteroidetes bacterium]|nr:hypothetical protein [Bacteroidota bacterium]